MITILVVKPKDYSEFRSKFPLEKSIPVTEDGKNLFPGALLFDLKTTHGYPLDFALDQIINERGMAVEWVAFIEAARSNQWWDYQTYEVITHALEEAQVPFETRRAIQLGFQRYVLNNLHPGME